MRKIIYTLLFIFCLSGTANAFTTSAKSAFLIDADSGSVLVSKNADTLMPPSSMIKLMTLAILFDNIKSGEIKIDDTMTVGENSDYKNPIWTTASKICLTTGQKLKVSDAILGLIVQSAGDVAVVVAERLAGSEAKFTEMMTAKAREIGMPKSTFGNATGLPDSNNLMTSRELATLGAYIISNHADLYPLFSTRRFEFTEYRDDWCRDWGRTHTMNYNKLLFIMSGADGMKTGHTDNGGYGMVASSRVGGRRLIAVINGYNGKNHNALATEVKKLLDWGYSKTTNKVFYNPGDKIATIPVWYGRDKNVIATVAKPFAITFNGTPDTSRLRLIARYDEPISAPIKKGARVGEIIAEIDGKIIGRTPIVARDSVNKLQFLGRVFKNLSVIFGGK